MPVEKALIFEMKGLYTPAHLGYLVYPGKKYEAMSYL